MKLHNWKGKQIFFFFYLKLKVEKEYGDTNANEENGGLKWN